MNRGVTAAALLAGAIAAGTQGTAATRRDSNDPALRRLLGVDAGAVLVARAGLPALLGAAWLALALALLAVTGELPGSVLLGLAAAWPTLRAVYAGHVHASTFGAQVAFAAVVLGGYLMITVRSV